jgi:dipeptidyl aminopeptidase/acylaminoacyl peptidase
MEKLVRYVRTMIILLGVLAFGLNATVVSPRQLVEVADFSNPVVSPDGAHVAYRVQRPLIERNVDESVWYVQDIDGTSPPIRVADGGFPLRDTGGIPLPAPATWSPDGCWIYFLASVDGQIDVWRAAANGSTAGPVTHDPADVRTFSLSDDGMTLRYSVGATRDEVAQAEQTEYDHGIRVDKSTPIGQSLYRSGYITGQLETQRLGPIWFERVPLLADTPDRWKAIDLSTGVRRDLVGTGIPSKPLTTEDLAKGRPEPSQLALDKRTGRVALLTRVGDGTGLLEKPDVVLAVLPSSTARNPVKCEAEACNKKPISAIQWRPGSDEVLFTVTDPDRGLEQSIFRWNVKAGATHLVLRSDGQVSGGGRWDPGACGVSASTLVCVTAEADRPPQLERIDIETGVRRVLFDPNAALASSMADIHVQFLHWRDEQGRLFTGQFYPAKGVDGLPPLFLSYYACPGFVRGGLGDEWPLAPMAERGISALCINAAPYRMDAVERYDIGLSAVRSVIKLLASSGNIDSTKVGMGGLSFGSEETIWVAMNSNLLTAASVSSPPVSPVYYLSSSLEGEVFVSRLEKYWQLPPPDKSLERWRVLSPVFHLDRIRIPILMQMPEQEYMHAIDYALPLIARRRADLYVFPNEPHQKFQPKHKLAVYERNLDWFMFWLRGIEDNVSTKAGQYTHWRAMKEALSNEHAP